MNARNALAVKTPLVLVFGLICWAASLQGSDWRHTYTSPLLDTSPESSPVTLFGAVDVRDELSVDLFSYSFEKALKIRNRSTIGILLVIVESNIEGRFSVEGISSIDTRDFFFAPTLLMPGETETIQSVFGPIKQPTKELEFVERLPRVTSRARFVQFADGSFWGDIHVAQEDISQRSQSMSKLHQLREEYEANGEDRFVASLMTMTSDLNVSFLQSEFKQSQSATQVLKKLDELLDNALLHEKLLKTADAKSSRPTGAVVRH